jgi:hypothetical protein
MGRPGSFKFTALVNNTLLDNSVALGESMNSPVWVLLQKPLLIVSASQIYSFCSAFSYHPNKAPVPFISTARESGVGRTPIRS